MRVSEVSVVFSDCTDDGLLMIWLSLYEIRAQSQDHKKEWATLCAISMDRESRAQLLDSYSVRREFTAQRQNTPTDNALCSYMQTSAIYVAPLIRAFDNNNNNNNTNEIYLFAAHKVMVQLGASGYIKEHKNERDRLNDCGASKLLSTLIIHFHTLNFIEVRNAG